jgi:hypothetical protein
MSPTENNSEIGDTNMIQTSPTTERRFDTFVETRNPTMDVTISPTRRTWWGPIIAGAFAAISSQILFTILGTAIGLSVLGVDADAAGQGLGIGASLWWLITGLVALFFGGWVAGRMCPTTDSFSGAMHGFLSWCAVTVVSATLVALASGALLGGTLTVMADALATNPMDATSSERLSNRAIEMFDGQVRGDEVSRSELSQSQSQTDSEVAPLPEMRNDAENPDRNSAADIDRPPLTEYQQEKVASKAALASWWTLAALLLGCTVASFGGIAGARCETRLYSKT